jgi:cytochrome P450
MSHIVDLLGSKPLAGALGLMSHYLFSSTEPDCYFYIIIPAWTQAWFLATVALYTMGSQVHSLAGALATSTSFAAVYFGTILLSMTIYRAFFHRLRSFPGPFLARISKFYGVSLASKKFQYYWEAQRLHEEYGDYVRTGPRELSIIDVDAIPVIHGYSSKCTKTLWYNNAVAAEGLSVHTTQDKVDHRERRKVWDKAFNIKALKDYEPRINRYARALMQRLQEHAPEPSLRISDWLNFYSFDVMGDIGFNFQFGMLEKGKPSEMMEGVHKSMAPISILGHIPWLTNMLLRTPVGVKDLRMFIDKIHVVLVDRKKKTPKEPDVFGWLLDPNTEDIPKNLNADTRLMVVAGSDTAAATLTWLTYELCKNPDKQKKLRQIIDQAAGDKTFLEATDVAEIPYLDGVINEALRLHPAVPSGVARKTPPEGIRINSIYIPGDTHVWTPPHTIQRDARYFPSPLTFLPERWTSEQPEMVVDKRAFLTFSTGPYNCVGQKLAMMEMRSITANLIRNFEIELAKDEDGTEIVGKSQDCFTLNVGKLDVRLTPRTVGRV